MKILYKKTALCLATLSLFASVTAFAGDVYVITNSSVNISADDVKDIYSGEKLIEGGTKLIPIDNNSLKADFLSKVMGMPADKYSSMWSKKVFRDGLTAPVSKSTDADVIALVKAKPGNIGYVAAPTADVKVVKKY